MMLSGTYKKDFGKMDGEEYGRMKQVVSAPLSEALVCVDSRDAIQSYNGLVANPRNPFDIQIYTGTQLFTGKVKRIKLKEINLTYNVPNVNPTNNILYLEAVIGGVVTQQRIIVPVGYYLPIELQDAVQIALNTTIIGGTTGIFGITDWEVVWNSSANTFRISSFSQSLVDVNVVYQTFRILPKLGQGIDPYVDANSGVSVPRSDTLSTMMGFNATGATYCDSVYSSFADMLYTKYIDVTSNFLTKNQYVIDRSTNLKTGNNLLARLYVASDRLYSISNTNIIGTRPFFFYKEFANPKEISWDENEPLASINIQLLDDKGNVLFAPAAAFTTTHTEPTGNSMYCGNSGYVQLTLGVSEAMGE